VVGSHEHSDEPSGTGIMKLVCYCNVWPAESHISHDVRLINVKLNVEYEPQSGA
jgi:hypothetical protein